jgi:dihydroorotase
VQSISRREFLGAGGAIAVATVAPARAAMGPTDKFDLVIKGGDVLDPSQSLRGKRDIGIRFGLIEAVEAEIPPTRALRVLDAAGRLVTPPYHPLADFAPLGLIVMTPLVLVTRKDSRPTGGSTGNSTGVHGTISLPRHPTGNSKGDRTLR